MKKYKELPKIVPSEYKVSAALGHKNYKLTEDSRLFRDKLVDFITKRKQSETIL